MALARSDSSAKVSNFATKSTDQKSQTSGDAFASSGFAALTGSSTSPFGTLGGSSAAATGSPFGSAGVSTSGRPETDNHEHQKPAAAANGGFSAFVNNSSTGFGSTDQSPFGTSGSSKTSFFGGLVFGSAFGGPLSGGSRLTSFAAPTGDAKLGISNGAIKPIGSPKRDEDEDENSESEGEGAAENRKDEETEEADGRFQHQDGRHNHCYQDSTADPGQWKLEKGAKIRFFLPELVFTPLETMLGEKAARGHSSSISRQLLQRMLLQTERQDVS